MKMFVNRWPLIISLAILLSGCQDRSSKTVRDKDFSGGNALKVIGPGGGGGVMKPTISPFDENFVMTHCDMTAAYLTLDGGEHWKMKNLWTVPEDFEFDPLDQHTVYAATRGYRYSEDRGSGLSILYRSEDRGESWHIVYPDLDKVIKSERLQNTDYLPSEIIHGALDGTIEKVEVDPADHRRIYLGLAPLRSYIGGGDQNDSDSAMLVWSTNFGGDWELITRLPGRSVKAIFPCNIYGSPGEILVFTESACICVNEHTGAISILPLPVKTIIAAEGGHDKDGGLLYIQSRFENQEGDVQGGMFVSRDIGRSWTRSNNGLFKDVPGGMAPRFRQGLAVCEKQPATAYISTINPVKNTEGDVEMIYCVFRTGNGGERWDPVLLSSTPGGYITQNFEGSWMEESFDPGWGGSPIDLGVAPGNADVCYAGDNGRGYKTTDGGKTWKQVYSHNLPDGSYASSGLDVTTCYGVHFDPFNPAHFFICYTDMGLFHTFNGGESWFHSITGVPRSWQNTCYDLTFDPDIKGKAWSVWANAHDLPRTKMFGRRGFDRFQGGVAVSEDDGRHWAMSNRGMPENAICTNILLDANSPQHSRTLYVSVFDKGIYKSVDGGKSWEEANMGLGNNLFAWEVRQNSEGRLFVLFARGERNSETVDGAIYFSDNNARSWKPLNLPSGVNGPHDLLIDPENPAIMYVSCWPRREGDRDTCGGVLKTGDGGTSWKQVFDERVRVNAAGMDPLRPETIYINTFQNAAYRSDDAGETWRRLEGYRFKWGQKAIPDVNHPGMIFLTTYGGSVFYGPAEGIPGIFEDIENMPEGWW
ncbi:MAG: hypothetical protein AMS26_17475 [Bacteroides sp. SM23_62]|nr:MAG: hypothetical protein AMS26_17475 [Bacteroides sp. SM23_62]